MEEEKITITASEYKKLLEISIRADMFADYVNRTRYVEREDCGRYLGFEVKKQED